VNFCFVVKICFVSQKCFGFIWRRFEVWIRCDFAGLDLFNFEDFNLNLLLKLFEQLLYFFLVFKFRKFNSDVLKNYCG